MARAVISALITNCSARKTAHPDAGLRFDHLKRGPQEAVAEEWKSALDHAEAVLPASALYCGRGVSRIQELGSRIGASLFVVSAGLGLVRGQDLVPSYDLSVSPGTPSAVQSRIVGRFSPTDWWQSLRHCRYSVPLRQAFAGNRVGLVLVAVSSAYVLLLTDEFSALKTEHRARLRLFGAASAQYPSDLREQLMPYDKRLDTLLPGPKVDFAQRAAEHFATGCSSDDSFPTELTRQHAWVRGKLSKVAVLPAKPRQSADDARIRAIAAKLAAKGISQTRALAILRGDQGIACEQTRFRRLFLEATR